jgi:hypothetical protein
MAALLRPIETALKDDVMLYHFMITKREGDVLPSLTSFAFERSVLLCLSYLHPAPTHECVHERSPYHGEGPAAPHPLRQPTPHPRTFG